MAYFQQSRKSKRVTLPSDKNLWVEVYKNLTWKEEKLVGSARLEGGLPLDVLLQNMIADWNLTDETGVAPIDSEHIDLLDREDALAIVAAIDGVVSAQEDDPETKKALQKK